mmetsp:Transcript_33050/g.65089  ORF Transcript_33050/g.65089 Transcript_33050/m.65089 type:complete len:225 (+) Transcript_33050:25-699(+)
MNTQSGSDSSDCKECRGRKNCNTGSCSRADCTAAAATCYISGQHRNSHRNGCCHGLCFQGRSSLVVRVPTGAWPHPSLQRSCSSPVRRSHHLPTAAWSSDCVATEADDEGGVGEAPLFALPQSVLPAMPSRYCRLRLNLHVSSSETSAEMSSPWLTASWILELNVPRVESMERTDSLSAAGLPFQRCPARSFTFSRISSWNSSRSESLSLSSSSFLRPIAMTSA